MDHVNLDLDLSCNGRFAAQTQPKQNSTPKEAIITPKVELEGASSAERAPPTSHASKEAVQQPPRGNNDVDAASSSQGPVVREQAAAANGRQLSSAGAVNNVEASGRTKMPRVYTRGQRSAGNETTVHGFLHRYDTLEAVSIICVCHGLCHTPAQFVEHAGGGAAEQEHPLRHIVVVDAAEFLPATH